MNIVNVLLAPGIMCLGLVLVYLATKKKGQSRIQKSTLLSVAWLAVALSFFVFTKVHGNEYGFVWGSGVLGILAWGIISWKALSNVGGKRKSTSRTVNPAGVNTLSVKQQRLKHLGVFFVAVPLSLVSITLFSLASALLLPFEFEGQVAFAALSFPVWLGLSSFLVYFYQKPSRDALILVFVASISAAWIFV